MRIRYIFLIVSTIFIACEAKKQSKESGNSFAFKEGDFLFQSMQCGPLCEAIEKVTEGYKGNDFSHMGMIITENDSLKVLEAVGKEVQLTPLDQFLNRSTDRQGNPLIMVGRLKEEYQALIPAAVNAAHGKLGIAYDDFYLMDNESLYCSELMYVIFKEAAQGKEIFELQPMTFKDPATGETFPVWQQYYDDLGIAVPDGKPGLNPGGISLSDKLEIIYSYSDELN
jgi:hypothetical protein